MQRARRPVEKTHQGRMPGSFSWPVMMWFNQPSLMGWGGAMGEHAWWTPSALGRTLMQAGVLVDPIFPCSAFSIERDFDQHNLKGIGVGQPVNACDHALLQRLVVPAPWQARRLPHKFCQGAPRCDLAIAWRLLLLLLLLLSTTMQRVNRRCRQHSTLDADRHNPRPKAEAHTPPSGGGCQHRLGRGCG
eukprot:10527059-Alexandrium_andersonii.AAC.1